MITPLNWSSTQSVIALSTGEAELYAINKAAASALGAQSLLTDLGVYVDISVYTDATSGKSMASRRGLGKVRHIAVNELWIQEHVQNKTIAIKKIKNVFNPADLLTKYLTKTEVQTIMEHIQNMFEKGRPRAAPKLANADAPLSAEINVVCGCSKAQICQCNRGIVGIRMILQVPLQQNLGQMQSVVPHAETSTQ